MVKVGPRVVLKTGPSFSLFPHFYSVSRAYFKNTNSVSLCQNSVFFLCKIVGMSKMRFSKRSSHFVFVFLCCCKRNRKKTNMEKNPKNSKNDFLKVVIQK